jgi:H+/Cl- antiporter ClcA
MRGFFVPVEIGGEMTGWEWIGLCLLACLCGAFGQLVRFLAGAIPDSTKMTKAAILQSLILALLVGACAGVIAALTSQVDPDNVTAKAVLSFLVAGYVGTDILEQFAANRTNKSNGQEHS